MESTIFVNEFSPAYRAQYIKSHAARVSHARRIHGCMSNKLAVAKDVIPRTQHDDRTIRYVPSWQNIPLLLRQPAPPLILGDSVSPDALINGPKYLPYYLNNAVTKCDILYPTFGIRSIDKYDWLPLLVDEMLFPALAANAQVAMDGKGAPSKDTLMYRGRAIQALRSHLVSTRLYQVKSSAVMAMSLLANVDIQVGDDKAFVTHRQFMGQIIAARGGYPHLSYDPYLSVVLELEMLWAKRTGYTVVPYQEPVATTSEDAQKQEIEYGTVQIPDGFQALYDEGRLSPTLLREIVTLQAEIGSHDGHHKIKALHRRYRYHVEAFPYLHISFKDDLSFEQLLELSILVFCRYALMPRASAGAVSPFSYVSRSKLAEQLPLYLAQHREASQAENDALWWMLTILLYSFGVPLPLHMQSLHKSMHFLFATPKAVDCLRAFLWTNDMVRFIQIV